jgi:hypothetical protein
MKTPKELDTITDVVSQPAITQAMRKRVAKAWANAERDQDLAEIEEKESA